MALANSPHLSVDTIVPPMLVVHGDQDDRVPIGEGLRLWCELLSKSALPADDRGRTLHRFLYVPDENHWVLSPQHAKRLVSGGRRVPRGACARADVGEALPEVLG